MQFIVVFNHRQNFEEVEANKTKEQWEAMFKEYMEGLLDKNITQVETVFAARPLPTEPDPEVLY